MIATAGSDEKCEACLKLGADHAINYKTADFAEAKRLTGGKGVDVILDMVAGGYVAREIDCLAEDGRLVIIAVQGGNKSEFNAGLRAAPAADRLPVRPCGRGRSRSRARSPRRCARRCGRCSRAGRIKPVIHSTLPRPARRRRRRTC